MCYTGKCPYEKGQSFGNEGVGECTFDIKDQIPNDSYCITVDRLAYIEQLEEQIKEAERVINFYADEYSWIGCGKFKNERIKNDSNTLIKLCSNSFEIDYDFKCGGKRAREYQNKYPIGNR